MFFDECVLNMLFLLYFERLGCVENKVASMSTILIMSGLFCYSKHILFQTQNSALEQAEGDYDKEKLKIFKEPESAGKIPSSSGRQLSK